MSCSLVPGVPLPSSGPILAINWCATTCCMTSRCAGTPCSLSDLVPKTTPGRYKHRPHRKVSPVRKESLKSRALPETEDSCVRAHTPHGSKPISANGPRHCGCVGRRISQPGGSHKLLILCVTKSPRSETDTRQEPNPKTKQLGQKATSPGCRNQRETNQKAAQPNRGAMLHLEVQ